MKLLLLFNHNLHPLQERHAKSQLKVNKISKPPGNVQRCWGQIPPELDTLRPWLKPVLDWLGAEGKPGDYVLVQGDVGACFLLATFCLQNGLVPVYATTARDASEKADSKGVVLSHRFEHVMFRKYGV